MSKLTVQLPNDVVARLRCEATRQQTSLDDLVRAVLENYLNDDEPTRDAALESLRQSMRDALDGHIRPARAVLAEIRRDIG